MKLIDIEALKYFYSKLEQIFSGVTVTIKPQVFTDEQKAQARANIGAGSADFTGDYNDLINKPQVAGQSSINAGKTIKSWSETDGKVSITTQDIEIVKEQISDFAHTHTVEDITDLDGMNFATEQYVADAIEALPSPMVFKGSLGTDGTITTLPNAVKANTGHTYKVITDNTYSGQKAKAGDMFISDGSKWVYIPSADEEGGVTSVNISVPTGLSVSGVPITTSGTIAITNEDGYSIPTDAKQTQWDKAFTHSESDHARVDATKVEASSTNGNIKIDGIETTVYEHPTQTAKTSGVYKIEVDNTGHVSNAVTATASDLDFDNADTQITSEDVQGAIEESFIPAYTKAEFDTVKESIKIGQKFIIVDDEEEGGGGDGFNYPDEIAMPGDQLYVKEVGTDGKPTKWTYQTLEGFNVYDTNSKTEYTSYTGSLNGYNFLDSNGDIEHTIYRIDASNLSIDGENQLFGIGDSMTIVSTKDKKNYIVIKRIDNDTVVAYNYVNKALVKTDTLLVFEKKPITIYGFHINNNESNPNNAVTYLEEAIGFTPAFMNYSTDTFNYGSWEDAFFMPRPCMLKSNGEVAYYLNPNDYSKKEDGSASDITNTSFDGNAMMEWGQNGKRIWVKKVADVGNPNSVSVYIADGQADEDYHAWSFIDKNGTLKEHFYTPIYQGSLISNKLRSLSTQNLMESTTAEQEISYATANGSGWNTEVWCDIELIQDLLVLMSKTLDTQTAFGMGNCNGYNSSSSSLNSGFEYHYGMLKPGSMNTKGLFWGKNSSVNTNGQRTGVKVFGMENLWANQWRRYAGMINDYGTIKIKKCYGTSDGSTTATYNTTGSGYINTGVTLSTSGYLNKMNYSVGSNIPSAVSGSDTTYYCDYTYANSSQVNYAFFGGRCGNGVGAGAFCFNLGYAASDAGWGRGAALSFK